MNRRALILGLMALVFSSLAVQTAYARRTSGEIIVQVYREPRRGRRIKLPNVLVRLNTGHTARTDKNGVARFRNMPFRWYRVMRPKPTKWFKLSRSVARVAVVYR